MPRFALALTLLLALAGPLQAATLRVTIDGFGSFDVAGAPVPVPVSDSGLSYYPYQPVTNLTMTWNGLTFTEADLLAFPIIFGGATSVLWTTAPLVAGDPLPRLLMRLSQGRFAGLSFGGLDCSTGPCFVPDTVVAVTPPGNTQRLAYTGSVATAPPQPTGVAAPAALAMLGVGLFGLVAVRRR
jgi:hypothetical protein